MSAASKVLAITELADHILYYIDTLQDLATCVRINHAFHAPAAAILWSGNAVRVSTDRSGPAGRPRKLAPSDVETQALVRLANDPERFRHYSIHVRRLRVHEPKIRYIDYARSRSGYLHSVNTRDVWSTDVLPALLNPELWSHNQLQWLDFSHRKGMEHFHLLEPLLQPKLRILCLPPSLDLHKYFVDKLEPLSLRWLEVDGTIATRQKAFMAFIKSQTLLIGLHFVNFDGICSAAQFLESFGPHPIIQHLGLGDTCSLPSDSYDDWKLDGFCALKSLEMPFITTEWISLLLPTVPALERLRIVGPVIDSDDEYPRYDGSFVFADVLKAISRNLTMLEELVLSSYNCQDEFNPALQAFARSAPRLRALTLEPERPYAGEPAYLSSNTLCVIAHECTALEHFMCTHVTEGRTAAVLDSFLRNCPALVVLGLRMKPPYMSYFDQDFAGIEHHSLWHLEFKFSSEEHHDEYSAAKEVCDLWTKRVPNLRQIRAINASDIGCSRVKELDAITAPLNEELQKRHKNKIPDCTTPTVDRLMGQATRC